MPKNLWNELDFNKCSTTLEQRVYSSRLIGADPTLVLHGGGNTSVKDKRINLFGEEESVLFIKGSGWDLKTIEPKGFPAVRMSPLVRLRELKSLDDVSMMHELRCTLTEAGSPDPSVETLLHAYLPHRFIDHTHADAVLTLTNQPNGEKVIHEIYGHEVAIVPYVMPGFELAKACVAAFNENPSIKGLILIKHGIFTFGESAKESYDRMIELVSRAEDYIRRVARASSARIVPPSMKNNERQMLLSKIRKCFFNEKWYVTLLVDDSEIAQRYVSIELVRELSSRGPITPDHIIRTKQAPCFISGPDSVEQDFVEFQTRYSKYFNKYQSGFPNLQMLDSNPRIFLVPKLGVVSAGRTAKEAQIALDIYQATMKVVQDSESISKYEPLDEAELFKMEYWVLEQQKLKLGPKHLPLTGKSAIVTGSASGIGLSIAKRFVSEGANVFLWDVSEDKLSKAQVELKSLCRSGNIVEKMVVDVTNRTNVAKAVETALRQTGGLDILVVNAGIFTKSAEIPSISADDWEASLNVNLNGAFHCVAETLDHLKNQNMGGDIVFVASKNVPAPGKGAGAYSVAKAGQTQLARVAALEAGTYGVRVNMVHPHLVFDTSLWTPEILDERAKAYGMTPEAYKKNNLLRTEISSADVASGVFALVSGAFSKTTGAQIPLDGGSDRTL